MTLDQYITALEAIRQEHDPEIAFERADNSWEFWNEYIHEESQRGEKVVRV